MEARDDEINGPPRLDGRLEWNELMQVRRIGRVRQQTIERRRRLPLAETDVDIGQWSVDLLAVIMILCGEGRDRKSPSQDRLQTVFASYVTSF